MTINRISRIKAAVTSLLFGLIGTFVSFMPVSVATATPLAATLALTAKKGTPKRPSMPVILRRRSASGRVSVVQPLTSLSHS